ncbi:MAG TPA: hypothetical protein VM659_03035 [Dongiaceae bacterium]|nr:hypothetical protein [Dongiaceae bacterium]
MPLRRRRLPHRRRDPQDEAVLAASAAVHSMIALMHHTGGVPQGLWRDPYALGFIYCIVGGFSIHAGTEEDDLTDVITDSFTEVAGPDGTDVLLCAIDLMLEEDADFIAGLQAGDKVVAVALGYPDYDKDADVIDARKRGSDLTGLMSEWKTAEAAGLINPDEAAVLYLQQRLFCHEVRRRLHVSRLH